MFNNKKILAFIGARAGSKGLPGKNTVSFMGKPLIEWTIEAARKSKYPDRIIVSTNCENIRNTALDCGVEAPFLRPQEMATDDAPLQDAILHGIDWISENEGQHYDIILSLQPTSPLRTADHIDKALEYYFSHAKTAQNTLVSVKRLPKKLGWIMEKKAGNYIDFCFPVSKQKLSRQNLKTFFLPNGAIYIAPIPLFRKQKTFYAGNTLFFEMKDKDSADIDTKEDLHNALQNVTD